jgi:hypothetical protein
MSTYTSSWTSGLDTDDMSEERATSTSGGQKGRKPQVFSLIPWASVAEISRVYHYGAKKYSEHNWRRGYPWSWSFDALIRHLTAWWDGENADPESGISHLAHAGFHILSLLWYELTGRGTDDRWKPPVAEGDEKFQISGASAASYPPPLGGVSSVAHTSLGLKGLAARESAPGELSSSYTFSRGCGSPLPRSK